MMDVLGYFHYPVTKTREYAQLRITTTVKYSEFMEVLLVLIIAYILLQNYLIGKNKSILPQFHFLKSINIALDQRIRRYEQNQQHVRRWLCQSLKNIAYALYLDLTMYFQVVFWHSLFLVMSLMDIYGGDLVFLAKRLGRLSVVSLPTVFFLTLRPSPLPNTLYLSLLPIHKWLSRVVVLLAVLHTLIYLGYFQVKNTWEKVWKLENVYGWVALLGFLLITITSLLSVRDRNYVLFFFNHYFWSWVIVLLLPFHIRPVQTTYVNVINVALLLYQVVYRLRRIAVSSSVSNFVVKDVSPNLACVEFPNSLIKTKAINPGAHVRITNYHPNFLVRLYKEIIPNYHPYTLVSLPQDRTQKLIVRKGAFVWKSDRKYKVFGSFDPELHFVKSTNIPGQHFSLSKLKVNARKLLIVVGGSAISFAIPILRVLNYHGIPVKVVWVIRDFRDIAILQEFEGYLHGDDFEIFVTGNISASETTALISAKANPYGTFTPAGADLEHNDISRNFNTDEESTHIHQEIENVDVDLSEEENDDPAERDCTIQLIEVTPDAEVVSDFSSDEDEADFSTVTETTPTVSRKSSRTNSINDRLVPLMDKTNNAHRRCIKTLRRLNLQHHIYIGRPKLNYRYYNWCVNSNDIFTQCSGPVVDASSNVVCCRDLPGRNNMSHPKTETDSVWVISAGPKSLVKNVKLWASENGLKYHEEAFYV